MKLSNKIKKVLDIAMCLIGFHKINIPRICKSEITLLGTDWGHLRYRLNK